MASEQGKWDKLDNIETKTARYYQGRQIVSKKELTNLWETTPKTIQRYIAKGMPTCEDLWQERFQIFFLDDCEAWKDINVNKSQSLKANKPKMRAQEVDIEQSEPSGDDDKDATKDIKSKIEEANELLNFQSTDVETAEKIDKILKALHSAVKLDELYKDLVPSKDVQKIIIEMVSGIVTGYKRNVKILPKECSGRDELEIREILNREYEATIKRLKRIAKSEFLEDNKIYDVLGVVYSLLSDGYSPKKLIDKLLELQDV